MHYVWQVNGINIAGTSGSVSALDFCSDTLTLAIGNECGLVRVKFLLPFSNAVKTQCLVLVFTFESM
jgi:hypothetical protein